MRPISSETANARFLNPQEVAETFVRSPFLADIATPANTALLGPRGSGKTTLLKMLTLPALLSWSDPTRDSLAGDLDYLSVYIPSSLTWNADYRGFLGGRLSEKTNSIISVSLFRHNVLLALLNTWQDASQKKVSENTVLSRFHLPIASKGEAELVRHLARRWELDLPISTVGGLREAISARLRLLQKLTVTASHFGTDAGELLRNHIFLGSHFLDDCESFADFLRDEYGFTKRISLCFDEVEIAPDAVADAILKMPRSIDQRFFVKFSAAPYVGVAATIRQGVVPSPRQDYQFVLLSSFSSKETRDFSEALFCSLARKHEIYEHSQRVLGPSLVDDSHEAYASRSNPYETAGAYQRRFLKLSATDKSFRKYASDKGIDVTNLTDGTENERAALIRKIIWPVLIREEFLFQQETTRSGASGRRRLKTGSPVSDIYTGAGSLFALCEGNPRQLIALMEPMLLSYQQLMNSSKPGVVRRSLQKKLVERMIAAYFALIATVPTAAETPSIRSLVDIISRVGNYFKGTVLGSDFNPDPVLSFEIDEALSPHVKELVGKGVNIGAFVIENVSKSNGNPYRLGEISGMKARLSNIFAPHFKLPLIGGRTVKLSTIINRSTSTSQPLLELFGEKI